MTIRPPRRPGRPDWLDAHRFPAGRGGRPGRHQRGPVRDQCGGAASPRARTGPGRPPRPGASEGAGLPTADGRPSLHCGAVAAAPGGAASRIGIHGLPRAAQPAHVGEGLHVPDAEPLGPPQRRAEARRCSSRSSTTPTGSPGSSPSSSTSAGSRPAAWCSAASWSTRPSWPPGRQGGARHPRARLHGRVRGGLPAGLRRSRQGRAGAHQPGRERRQVRLGGCASGSRRRVGHRGRHRPDRGGDPGRRPAEGVHQVLPPRPRPPTGTGLGLWISQGLVEAHGGRLTATSVRRRRHQRSGSRCPIVDVRRRRPPDGRDDWRPPPTGEHPSDHDRRDRRHRGRRRRPARRLDLDELAPLDSELLGKRSADRRTRSSARSTPTPAATSGRALNEARATVEAASRAPSERGLSERASRIDAERLDLTEVPPGRALGHLHLVTQAMETLEDVFVGMGFTVAEGPEVEDRLAQLRRLNFPPGHPARDMYDTLYVEIGEPGSTVLRTHTSPVQIRVMSAAGAADLLGHARPGVPQRGHRRHPPRRLPPDRGPGDRPRHHLRPPGRHDRRLHQGLLGRRLLARGCDRRTSRSPSRRPSSTSAARRLVARAGRLRDGPPQRAHATAGIDPEEWQGARLRLRPRPPGHDATASTTSATSANDIRFLTQF